MTIGTHGRSAARAGRTVGIASVLGLIAAGVVAHVATASLVLELTPSSGPSGTVIRGATVGSGAVLLARNKRLPLYLIPSAAANDVRGSSDNRLISVGELVVNDLGDGTTSFPIPDVSPGPYTAMVYCEPCAPSSRGRSMLAVGDLSVSAPAPSPDAVASWPVIVAGLILAIAAVATLVGIRRPRAT